MADAQAAHERELQRRTGNGAHSPYLPPRTRELRASRLNGYFAQQQRQQASGDDYETESNATVSTWTEFLQNYSIRVKPECCLKVRKRVSLGRIGETKVGADIAVPFQSRQPQLSLIAKPQDEVGRWIDKVTVYPTERAVEALTPRFQWWTLRLQMGARLAPFAEAGHKMAWQYRITTQWARTAKTKYKFKRALNPQLVVAAHTGLNMLMPEVTGTFGEESRQVETGYCHLSVPKLQLRVDLDGGQMPHTSAADDGADPKLDEAAKEDLLVRSLVPNNSRR